MLTQHPLLTLDPDNYMNNDLIFVDGLYSNPVSDKAPSWILGSLSIKPDVLVEWLQNNENLKNERGYINLKIQMSKAGKRMVVVDTWKKETQDVRNDTSEPDMPSFDFLPEADVPFI